MRSTDRGATWQEMVSLTGVPTSGHGLNLATHPVTNTLYFLTESSVLRSSTDSGDSWSSPVYVGFGATLLLDNTCLNRLFGGEMERGLSVGGVYFSENWGQTFSEQGPAYDTITSLALSSAGTRLLAVASGAGLWQLDIGGTSCSEAVPIFVDAFESGNSLRWSSTSG